MSRTRPNHRDDFRIAIICALPLEYDAVSYVLDEFWDEDGDQYGRATGDPNSYTTGCIGDYNVVLALLPHMGKTNAASAAASMRSSYSHIRLALLVGVCGGVPRHENSEVFLGDVVISQTVIQYDFGRQYSDKFVRKDTVQDNLGRPNKDVRNLLATFRTDRGQDKLQDRVTHFLHQLQRKVNDTKRWGKYDYPGAQEDQLFAPQHRHRHYSPTICICRKCLSPLDPVCDEGLGLPCSILGCDEKEASGLQRIRSESQTKSVNQPPQPSIHLGVVVSGDFVLKSAIDRKRIQEETRAIAFEMEGAGVWDEVPCIVLKSVCDYADSHKQKGWQNYAAATAAAASKAVLERYIHEDKVRAEQKPEAAATTIEPRRNTPLPTGGPVEQVIKPFSTVPFPPDARFIERPAISRWLRSTLIGPGCRAALVGLGGVGKSQIAIQHAHEVRREAPRTYILWVHASSSARFQEAYQDIAERLKLPGRDDPQQNVLRMVHRWLSDDENGPWLMVIDNADDDSTLFSSQDVDVSGSERPLASYIPKTGRGSVLVTSRSLDAAVGLVGDDDIFQVPVMESYQATELLRGRLGELYNEESDVAGLLTTLNYLPLAIIQAASYIKRRSLQGATVTTYLEEFRRNEDGRIGLLAREVRDLRRDESASNAVVATWQITFNQVKRDRGSAARLLYFISFFNPQGIPDFILRAYLNESESKDLEDDIEVLRGYSLIVAIVEDGTFEIHALVQFCTQEWLSTFDDKEKWRSEFLGVMSSQYPYGNFENWTSCRKLDPHIEDIVKTRPVTEDDIMSWAALLYKVASYRLTSGRFSEAEMMNRQTLEVRTKVLGAEHPDTLGSMNNLASVFRAQGKNEEAEKINRQTLEVSTKVLGAEHPDTLVSISNLALVLWDRGKNEEAEKIYRQTLEVSTKVLGAEHPDTLISISNLALVLWDRGKNEEAEKINRQTLEVSTKVLGAEHPDTLISMNNLALVLWGRGKNEEAEKIYRQTLEVSTKVLGAEHPDTLTTMSNLGCTLRSLGKQLDATTLLRECVHLCEIKLGFGHPHTRVARDELGRWISEE